MKRLIYVLLGLAPLGMAAQAPMTLRQCIDYALERNVQVKQQDLMRRKGEVALSTARNSRLPEVSASGSQSFNFGRGLTAENTYVGRNTQTTNFGVNASLPLFTGFRLPNQTAQARLDLQAATADLQKVREDLSIQVAQSYLEVLYKKDICQVSRNQLALSRKQKERVQAFFENKKASGLELSEADSRVAQDELTVVQDENAYKLALLDLSQLLEMPTPDSHAVCPPDDAPPAAVQGSPQEIFSVAATEKPAIRAEELRIESAGRGIRIARSGYWPTLSLNAGLGSSFYKTAGYSNTPFGRQMRDNFNKSKGLSLNIPIFDHFTTRNNIRQAKLEYESRQQSLEATRKSLYKEIQQAWYNAVASQQKYTSSIFAERAAEEAFLLMTKKYENGKANATEYDETRTKRIKAQFDRISALYDYLFRTKILDFYRGREIR